MESQHLRHLSAMKSEVEEQIVSWDDWKARVLTVDIGCRMATCSESSKATYCRYQVCGFFRMFGICLEAKLE